MTPSRIAAVLAAAVLLAGCGAGGSGTGPTGLPGSATSGGPAPDADEFSRCMTRNGAPLVSVEGGDNGNGNGQASAPAQDPADEAAEQAALEKCREFLPDGGNPTPMSAEQLEQQRAIAACMREAGVPYPDPDPQDAAGPGSQPIPSGVDLNDPAVLAKLQKCTEEATGKEPNR